MAVTGLPEAAVAVSAGDAHTCAMTTSAAVWCWGAGHLGQLGAGRWTASNAPVAVTGLPAGVRSISAGVLHTCALADATTWCWGRNIAGEVGDGTTTNRPTPVSVALPAASAVDADGYTCAVAAGAWCWGLNRSGGLGDGTTTRRNQPVPVIGLPATASQIAVGADHACAIAADAIYCWGAGGAGQLGNGTMTDRSTATLVP